MGGKYLPVCARDTGIYFGFLLVLLALMVGRRWKRSGMVRPPAIYILLIMAIPMAIDGMASYIGLYETTNYIRLISGLLFGGSIPILFLPFINENLNKKDQGNIIEGPLEVIGLASVLFICSLLIFQVDGELAYVLVSSLVIIGILVTFFIFFYVLTVALKFDVSTKKRMVIGGVVAVLLEFVLLALLHFFHDYLAPLL